MKLVFATHNTNKLKEVQLLIPSSIELLSLGDIGCTEDIAETGQTLEENALIKANYIRKTYGLDCFADDTGLLVDKLKGAPGVKSARYAGPEKDSEANMQKLLQQLNGVENRKAHFKTVIALVTDSGEKLFSGKVLGVIGHSKKGQGGFGYDPLFIPNGYQMTFAEMPLAEKNKISHRGKALVKLIDHLNKI